MAHKNYGGIAHTNTGYTNHTNVNSGGNGYAQNHQQYHQHYHNHTNYKEYHQAGGYVQSGYSVYNQYLNSYSDHVNYSEQYYPCGGCGRDDRKSVYDILKKNKIVNFVDFPSTIAYYQYGYAAYRQHSNSYSNHTNYGNHTNYTDYHQAGYSNGYTQAYGQYNQSSGYNNHSNTGYTNHVNATTNVAPGNVANVSRGSSAYYKSTIALTWTAATDNNKVIWGAGAWWQNYDACPDRGIWENNSLVQAEGRSWCAVRWNASGTRISSSGVKDTYGNAATVQEFINYLNTYSAGDYFVILGSHEIMNNSAPIINHLKGWGFKTPATDLACWVGICKMHTGILAEQGKRYYGSANGTVSASYTIPGVASSQTITYYIDYAFKPIGGSYGAWTRIVNGHTTNSYNYSLASHGNGHIKFRVLSSDGVENGSTWVESSEVRVLKYDAPAFSTTSSGNIADDADGELVRVEINKLCVATGQSQATSGITAAKVMSKTDITDLRDKIKAVGTAISKTNITDTNLDLIRPADLQNIKNWIKTV